MTRGTFYLFTKDSVYSSNEFNGTMYPDGFGCEAAKGMMDISSSEELLEFTKEFNKKHYDYPDEEVGVYLLANSAEEYEKYLDTIHDYFEKYFSDYIFIKNESGKDLIFTTNDGPLMLEDGDSGILHYGELTEFPEAINNFKVPAEAKEIKRIANVFDIVISGSDIQEAYEIMQSHNFSTVNRVYKDLVDYTMDFLEESIEKWMYPYFDFAKYAKDIRINLADDGVYELKSGIVLEFQ